MAYIIKLIIGHRPKKKNRLISIHIDWHTRRELSNQTMNLSFPRSHLEGNMHFGWNDSDDFYELHIPDRLD